MSAAPDVVEMAAAGLTAACSLLSLASRSAVVSLNALIERDRRETPRPSRSVLVLDDSLATLLATEHLLRALGVPILRASTPAEARVVLRRDRPAAIVADYHLDGETCLALLRERPTYCRAVIVTGRVDLDVLRPLARAVTADLLDRPIDDAGEHALVELVRSYLPPEAA